jgi:hypothetical protein
LSAQRHSEAEREDSDLPEVEEPAATPGKTVDLMAILKKPVEKARASCN